jgi:hypothetical protein
MIDEYTGKKIVSPLDLTSKTAYIITAQEKALSTNEQLPESEIKAALAQHFDVQSVQGYHSAKELAADIVVNYL